MTDITDDEFTVLLIAAQGEYMLPIGRWKPSIESLAGKGLMCMQHINGGPQYTITRAGKAAIGERGRIWNGLVEEAAGKAAIGEREQQETSAFVDASAALVAAQKIARDLVEATAKALAQIAQASSKVTGDTPETSARKWSPLILERALDILNGG